MMTFESIEAIEEAHRQSILTIASLINRRGLDFLETNLV
jgi:hypothetical protein